MAHRLAKFKPGIKRQTHLLLSALFWTFIGIFMVVRGILTATGLDEFPILVIVTSLVAGSLKSYVVLDKAAEKSIKRILTFKDNTCLGAVYSIKTWLLVLFMMMMGVFLRKISLPGTLLCFVYFTIGWALLYSSRVGWLVWFKRPRG